MTCIITNILGPLYKLTCNSQHSIVIYIMYVDYEHMYNCISANADDTCAMGASRPIDRYAVHRAGSQVRSTAGD